MTKSQTVLFYILSFTWGILTSIIGLIVILICLPFKRVKKFHNRLYAVIGNNWGGLELGCFFVCGKNCQSNHLMCHECGHGFQNIIWGPLYIFVIGLPSVARYWYREAVYKFNREKYVTLPDYDAIWFEGQATRWGKKVYNEVKK